MARTHGVLAGEVERAATPWRRVRGLIGRRRIPGGYALLIEPCRAIHTWFMRCPIDAVFVDRHGTVVRVLDGLAPFRVASGGRAAHAVLELEAGAARRAGVRRGDRLTWQPPAAFQAQADPR